MIFDFTNLGYIHKKILKNLGPTPVNGPMGIFYPVCLIISYPETDLNDQELYSS